MRDLLYAKQRLRSDGGGLIEVASALSVRMALNLAGMIEGHGSNTRDAIEGGAERAGCPAARVAAQRPADGFDVGAELEREAADDGAVARGRVRVRANFCIRDEDLGEPTVRMSAD